ncbi:uncharacterized protein EDB91DRAFT_1239997 [Suillus paluster]|uniref:uncharacterized protein n=1 Tax=Suillus paluster TaxID=48578 RepID=UPI001B860FD9|nr:uncharacterized protein EDB91DRAFT_1239997 [Suillus paluster]KAG1724156.1 hypothetical protein EDB91DRAFT_1239997 [Suillus paluster]
MSSSPPFHVPHSTTSNNGHTFTCPNCADIFSSIDNVIHHLSTTVTCGQRVVQGLTLDFGEPSHFSQDYDPDTLEHGQDAYNPPLSSVPNPEQYHPSTPESVCDTPLASVDPSAGPHPSTFREYHPNVPITHPRGENHLQKMDRNVHAAIHHTENLYYPFASKAEFDLGYWLSEGVLSQKEVDVFLHLEHTKNNPPSFNTSKDLRARIKALPEVPRWYHQQIKVGSYKTKAPLVLYWRDGLDVVKHLFANPVFVPCMDFQPYQEFKGADIIMACQDKLPPGHSFVGVIGASDKTPLTIGTGNKEMHPLLISLTNIHVGVHMKATSHAFALVAYLPIPKFLNVSKPVHAILSAGDLRMIHIHLVAWIADYPEQLLIACTASKRSSISLATAAQFGDPLLHPPRTRSNTLDAIERVCTISDPCDIASFYKTCQALHLNGVVEPYWKDWGHASPSFFLTPDGLHQWHKFYFDHPINWSINIMGGAELDRVHHWANGVSMLKQLTVQEHRDLEKLLPGVIVGAVPDEVACALCAITEFIFQAQNLFLYDETLHSLSEALRKFHYYKDFILTAGGHHGKNSLLNHFQIPKLELMQHVARSTRAMGAPYQWSSDITEHCHITHVKRPYRMSNRRDFHGQCCRFLDQQEKLQFFQLYTVLKSQRASLIYEMSREANTMVLHYPEATWISTVLPGEQYAVASKPITSLFTNNCTHFSSDDTVTILLTCHPHFHHLSIEEASQCFHIPDLCPVLGDLISGRSYLECSGRRICRPNCSLSFDYLHIWQKFHMQQRSTQDSCIALAPSSSMPFGRGDTVLITHESGKLLLPATSERYLIVQVKAIIQPITEMPRLNQPFLYVKFFNFSHSSFSTINDIRFITPAPVTDMFSVQCRVQSNHDPLGDIVPLDSVCQVIELIPKCGREVPLSMNRDNSLQLAREFYVNNFADKETFHAILSYQ